MPDGDKTATLFETIRREWRHGKRIYRIAGGVGLTAALVCSEKAAVTLSMIPILYNDIMLTRIRNKFGFSLPMIDALATYLWNVYPHGRTPCRELDDTIKFLVLNGSLPSQPYGTDSTSVEQPTAPNPVEENLVLSWSEVLYDEVLL